MVILGRGGFRVLRGLSDVLNVFVTAPDAVRAKRIGKRDEIGVGEAADYLGKPWDDQRLLTTVLGYHVIPERLSSEDLARATAWLAVPPSA